MITKRHAQVVMDLHTVATAEVYIASEVDAEIAKLQEELEIARLSIKEHKREIDRLRGLDGSTG